MKTALPWLLVLALLGGVYFLFAANREKTAQITALQDQVQDLAAVRAENQDLRKISAENEDVARLKRENEDLLRLRGENQRLKSEAKQAAAQLAAARAGGTQAEQARQQQLSQLAAENEALKNQVQAGGAGQTPAQPQAGSCIANLRQLSLAKQLWAQDNKKGPEDVPTTADLAPYFPNIDKIACPDGGTYSINAMNTPPTCSIPGHTLAPQLAPPPPQQP